MSKEAVNHPSHYRGGVYEVINIIVFYKLGFCLGNVAKYILRAGAKDPDKELEDLKKARWYLDYEIATRDGTAKGPDYFIELAKKGADLGIPKEDLPTFPEMNVTIDDLNEMASRRTGITLTYEDFMKGPDEEPFRGPSEGQFNRCRDTEDEDIDWTRWAKRGDMMVFTNSGGYDYERQEAAKKLSTNVPYEVVDVFVEDWKSCYTFKGVKGTFNTVMFKPWVESSPNGYR